MRRTVLAVMMIAAPLAVAVPAAAGEPAAWAACQQVIGIPLDPAVADCAVVAVPVDHRRPADGTVGVVTLRRKATDPSRRIGALFVNPGGPGTSGLHFAYRAERFLPAEVLARFDVIGFDPRGVGQSAALRCFASQEEHDEVLGGRVSVPVGAEQVGAVLRADRTYTRRCAERAGPLLAHMSTADVARDLDVLRAAAGEPVMRFVGLSYGTFLGATYANLFPDRTAALVLDGNVDPRLRTADGLEYDRQRADGYEEVLAAFLHACAAAGPACALAAGGDPAASFAAVRERLRGGPVTLPDGRQVTLSTFVGQVIDALSAGRLPELARIVADLAAGGPAAAILADPVVTGESPYRSDDSADAVNCLDKAYPPVPSLAPLLATLWEVRAPTFGRLQAFDGAACATWPVRSWESQRYSGPWNRPTAGRALVIGNRHDPVTQLAFARRMAAALDRAVLLEVDRFGHTALGLNRCADALTSEYLIEGTLPATGAGCPADAPPFPR